MYGMSAIDLAKMEKLFLGVSHTRNDDKDTDRHDHVHNQPLLYGWLLTEI